MFSGSAAWFSTSVQPADIEKWTSNKGKVVKKHIAADFYFSASCCAQDTKSLMDPTLKKHGQNDVSSPITVLHPLFIDKCISQGRLLGSAVLFDYALPSEELLPVVAQQRGEQCSWLLDLAKEHFSHTLEHDATAHAVKLSLDRDLGLRKKPKLHPSYDESIGSSRPLNCREVVFGTPTTSSVPLKDIPVSKCQLRLLRIHAVSP